MTGGDIIEPNGRDKGLETPDATWLAAALDWWRDAGLAVATGDDVTDWLAPPVVVEAVAERGPAAARENGDAPPAPREAARSRAFEAPSPAMPAVGGERGRWPATLDDFAAWWMREPSLAAGGAGVRVPPAGPHGAALMVVVPMPEAEDGEALLSGREGRLLDAMLAAFGLSREATYVASALPGPVRAPDFAALGEAGFAAILRHHVGLVAPRRVLFLGRNDISSLLSHDPANKSPDLSLVNQEGLTVAARADYGLASLLAQPALKAATWRNWIEWLGDTV